MLLWAEIASWVGRAAVILVSYFTAAGATKMWLKVLLALTLAAYLASGFNLVEPKNLLKPGIIT